MWIFESSKLLNISFNDHLELKSYSGQDEWMEWLYGGVRIDTSQNDVQTTSSPHVQKKL